jgi:hypothetical protein
MILAGVVLIVIGVVFLLGGPIYARTHASASVGFIACGSWCWASARSSSVC